ncbi:MAG: hypothetical protein RSD44_01415 [Akkermansia sp.]
MGYPCLSGWNNAEQLCSQISIRPVKCRFFYDKRVKTAKLLPVNLTQSRFYIDCDVELFKSLRTLQTDDKHLVMGYMYKCALGTAMFYSPPQHPILKEILNLYNEVKHESWPVSNSIYTDYFINNVPNFLLNGKAWENENITLYPKEFFEQPAFIPSQGYSIHHCCGSWDPNSKNKTFALSLDSNHWIKWLKRKINTARALRKNEYYEYYKQACKGISVKKPSTWRQSK